MTPVPSARLPDGATVNQGQVIASDTTERFYVVGILEVTDQGDSETVIVLRNLTNGSMVAESISLFQNQRKDGYYVL